jgi:hypothetical protein
VPFIIIFQCTTRSISQTALTPVGVDVFVVRRFFMARELSRKEYKLRMDSSQKAAKIEEAFNALIDKATKAGFVFKGIFQIRETLKFVFYALSYLCCQAGIILL